MRLQMKNLKNNELGNIKRGTSIKIVEVNTDTNEEIQATGKVHNYTSSGLELVGYVGDEKGEIQLIKVEFKDTRIYEIYKIKIFGKTNWEITKALKELWGE